MSAIPDQLRMESDMKGDILYEEEVYALLNGGECDTDELYTFRDEAVDRLSSDHELTEALAEEEGFEIKKVKVVITQVED